MLRRSIAATWLLLCLGCGPADGRRAAVDVDRIDAGTPELRAALESAVGAALTDSATFFAGPGGLAGGLRLAAWVSASDLGGPPRPGGATPSALFLHLELEVPAELRKQFDVPAITARSRLPDVDPDPETLASAARSALEVLALRLALARGDAAAAAHLLGADDPDLVLLALEWTRDHPSPLLADAVAGQVERGDPAVVRLALEVLEGVGQARHGRAVVRRIERSPALARDGYRALGVLGGPDAVGFLRFAAANEDDPELRREAERALSAALADGSERVTPRPHGVDLPRVARGHRQ
jgi:hypothetical protein